MPSQHSWVCPLASLSGHSKGIQPVMWSKICMGTVRQRDDVLIEAG